MSELLAMISVFTYKNNASPKNNFKENLSGRKQITKIDNIQQNNTV